MFPINAALNVALLLTTVESTNIRDLYAFETQTSTNIYDFETHLNPSGISTAPQGLAKLGDEPKHHLRHRKYSQQGPSFHNWAKGGEDGQGAWPHDITDARAMSVTRAKSHATARRKTHATNAVDGVGVLNLKPEHADAADHHHGGKPGAGGKPMVPRTHEFGEAEKGSAEWSYDSTVLWEEGYPLCGGKLQSPIDLPGNINIDYCPEYKPPEPLQTFYVPLEGLHLDNNGHNLQLNGKFGNITLKGGTYQALQLNFHFTSEHMVNGTLAPGEMQIVHQKIGANGTNELAVIAILLTDEPPDGMAPSATKFMAQLGFGAPPPSPAPAPAAAPAPPPPAAGPAGPVDQLPKEGASHPVAGVVDIGQVFGQQLAGGYYHYEGSLTTPPCSETVDWFVLSRRASINKDMIDNFKKLFPSPANNRPVQLINDRPIEFGTDKISSTKEAEAPPARDLAPRGSKSCFLGLGLLLAMIVNA